MKIIMLFTVTLFILSFASCAQFSRAQYESSITSNTAILKTTLLSLDLEYPENDISKNISNKDYRLIGICGLACYAPKAEGEKNVDIIKKYGLKILEGTSDVIEGNEHMILIKRATKYAQTYNEILLNKIWNHEIP